MPPPTQFGGSPAWESKFDPRVCTPWRAMHHAIDLLFGAQSLPGLWGYDANGDPVITPDELVCLGRKPLSSNIVAEVMQGLLRHI